MDRNQILRDQTEAKEILKELSQQTKQTIDCVSHIMRKIREENTQKGLSFLNVKCHMMLGYLTNFSYVVLRKLTGKSLRGESVVDRLVEIRTVLEKMRPIDQKLKYQIDKLMVAVATGTSDADDPLRFKPNPDNLVNKIDDDESEGETQIADDSAGKDGKKSRKLYAPPKLSAVYYEEDKAEKQQRLYEKAKKRALSSTIMQELRQEYDEGPEEIRESTNLHRLRDNKNSGQVNEYEEMNMIRIQQNKQMQHKSKELLTMSRLSGVTRFEDLSVLETNPEDFTASKKKKRSKQQFKKKGKKSFKKRRHF